MVTFLVQVAIVAPKLVQVYKVQTVLQSSLVVLVSQLKVLVSLVVLALLWGPRKAIIEELVL